VALLEPADLEALERLALATRARMLGTFAGDHRSPRFGSSLDFADYREYRPGDDFRRIDVPLSARLDRLFLRLFEAEEDVSIRIVVDTSASMGFGDPSKVALARRIAAGFAHLSLAQGDAVRLYETAGRRRASRWYAAKADSIEAMRWLEAAAPAGPARLADVVRALREEGRTGLTLVVSDLLEPGWEDAIRRLGAPGEAALVHLLAPEEMEPSLEGDLTLLDAETGAEVPVSMTPEVLRGYRARLAAWLASVRSACTSRGIGYVRARSDEDAMDLFRRRFRSEAVVR